MAKENHRKYRSYHLNKIKSKCEICNVVLPQEKLDIHRIIPAEYGGEYTEENTIIVCEKCHGLIHKLIRIEKRNGRLSEFNFNDFVIAAKNIVNENFL